MHDDFCRGRHSAGTCTYQARAIVAPPITNSIPRMAGTFPSKAGHEKMSIMYLKGWVHIFCKNNCLSVEMPSSMQNLVDN